MTTKEIKMNMFSKDNKRAQVNKAFCTTLIAIAAAYAALFCAIRKNNGKQHSVMNDFANQPAATAVWANADILGLTVGLDTTGDGKANYLGFKKDHLVTTNELGATKTGADWLPAFVKVKQYE